MERLHAPPESIIAPRIYSASSIADMVNGGRWVIEERRYEIERWRAELHGIKEILALPSIWQSNEMVKSPAFCWAVVKLPSIRHFPEKDEPETRDRITIFDSTGEVEVTFPRGDVRRLANDWSKFLGIKFDPQLLKKRSWISDVVLLNGYGEEKKESIYHLVSVMNRLASEPDRDPASVRENNPALSRSVMA